MKTIKRKLLFFYPIFLMAASNPQSICVELKEEPISQNKLKQLVKIYGIQNSDLAKDIYKRKKLFAKEYLKSQGLKFEDKVILEVLIINYLSQKYVNNFLKTKLPSDQEAKSYYLLHKKEFRGDFNTVKEQVKRKMLTIKAPSLIQEEYQRLKNEDK